MSAYSSNSYKSLIFCKNLSLSITFILGDFVTFTFFSVQLKMYSDFLSFGSFLIIYFWKINLIQSFSFSSSEILSQISTNSSTNAVILLSDNSHSTSSSEFIAVKSGQIDW
jgi:hypothetical protein